MKFYAYTKERGNIMKNIIKKSITTIIIFAMALTLAMPVTAQAAKKKAPKISKTKVTMTITKKKTKPAVQLKVKNVSAKNVKWTTSNKKVATVSKNGKVVAKKKGNAVITVKVKGSKTLRCKVTVKDNRKPVTNARNVIRQKLKQPSNEKWEVVCLTGIMPPKSCYDPFLIYRNRIRGHYFCLVIPIGFRGEFLGEKVDIHCCIGAFSFIRVKRAFST